MFSASELGQTLAFLTPGSSSGYVIGLSGGADSCALLAAAAELRASRDRLIVRAVHVDHGLQADSAAFAERCAALCQGLAVPLEILTCSVRVDAGRSVEEVAREARYATLAAALRPGECLLTAHHEQDQAETFLLQALRGAGVKGLAAMPGRRRLGPGWHLRPLLNVSRADLRSFAAARDLPVIQDAMNEDRRFDRAYLRQAVWPSISARWPAASEVLARSAAHVAQSLAQLDEALQRELRAAVDGEALSLPAMRRLPAPRRSEVLRAFIDAAGARPPPRNKLQEALRQMLGADADKMPVIQWGEHALRRYRGRIHLTPARIAPVAARNWAFRETPVCELGPAHGRLVVRSVPGGIDPALLPGFLQVRSRREAPVRSVRHLLQEHGVVPWMRDSIPFIHIDKTLLAVADLWSDARFRRADFKTGIAFEWEGAPSIL